MCIKNELTTSSFVKMRRDIILIYLFFLLASKCQTKNWSSLRKMDLHDLNDAINHLTRKQKKFISGKIEQVILDGTVLLLHYFGLSVRKARGNVPVLQIQLLRNNFMDEFNEVKNLLEMFSPFVSGALRTIDEKNIHIYYLPNYSFKKGPPLP